MGFQWGIALGAAANSGLSNYSRLSQIQMDQARNEREGEVHDAWKLEQQQKKDEAADYASTIGSKETTQQEAIPGTMGQSNLPDGQAGPTAEMRTVDYTDSQKNADFTSKRAAGGGDPIRGMQVSAAARADKDGRLNQEFKDWDRSEINQIQNDLPSWVAKNVKGYNKANGKGGPEDDGHTMSIVNAGDGKAIITSNAKGKPISSTPMTIDQAMEIHGKRSFERYKSLNFSEGTQLGIKQGTLDLAKDKAIHENRKDDAAANYYNNGGASSRKETLKSKAADWAEVAVESGENDPKTNKPWTTEGAKKAAYGILLKDPNSKPTTGFKSISGGDGSLQENGEGVQREWDPKKGAYVTRGQPNEFVTKLAAAGAPDSKPAQAIPTRTTPAAAPQPVKISISDKLIDAGNNPAKLQELAVEAAGNAPRLAGEIKKLQETMKFVPATSRQVVEARIVELQNDLQSYTGILEQQKAKRGY